MSTFLRMWNTPSVRRGLLFIVFMLVVFRVAAHIPVPGIDATSLGALFQNNQFFGLLNIFSGGTLENFSLMALGVAPYITSSIIFQLLGMVVPSFEEMQKEETGRQRINQWTRLLTVPLAALQAYGLILLLGQQTGQAGGAALLTNPGVLTYVFAIAGMTAGTVFLMWVGELISERQIGNGISILILAGIIAGLPTFLGQTLSVYDKSQMITLIAFIVAVVVTIAAIVVMNEAVRNIPVQYSRQVRGARLSGAVSSHIPLRLNMGGVIPIIFAISIILLPSLIGQFFANARTEVVRSAAQWLFQTFQNQLVYGVAYFVLVFAFSYFYTSVVFHPDRVAENLQRQGGFIPGIRPGQHTSHYLGWVTNRILLVGATFLSIVAVLPLIVQNATGNANLVIGGTSILIVVAVIIDAVKQVEAQMTMHEYDL